ncbi:hypothetical protein ABFP25_00255 [Acinetobacter indicus]|jgi:triacylglycerol lipase|uniref:hypothetical protein n=1 Tax=Acinetobacter indicus TaxID=756892 RepID=UPI003215CD6F
MTGNTQVTNPLDVSDAAMKALDLISAHKGGTNDGIVSVCSAKFGKPFGMIFHGIISMK